MIHPWARLISLTRNHSVSEADTRGARGRRRGRAPTHPGVSGTTPANPSAPDSPVRSSLVTAREPEEPQSKPEPALVLIVEDEQPIAEAISFMVQDAGYATVIASNGQQGLELARARRPALIFTDLMMPRMDGTALIAALHADAAHDSATPAPIILMTAAGFEHAQKAGADAILPKPFDITEVERLLRRFLKR